jgi:hypothetical protein
VEWWGALEFIAMYLPIFVEIHRIRKIWLLLLVLTLHAPFSTAFRCPYDGSPGWPDVCDGTASTKTCKPFARLPHDGSRAAWEQARVDLISSVFGAAGPPTRSTPDVGPFPYDTPVVFDNCMCLLRGECPASACARPINATTFKWNISVPVNASYSVFLQSQVIHSLNSSGIAAGNTEKFESDDARTPTAQWPEVSIYPQTRSKTLVIFHDGHAVTNGCHYDVENVVDWFNRLGYDAMHLQMPLHGCNAQNPMKPLPHEWFAQFAGIDGKDSAKFPFMKFFLDPVWLTINYAKNVLGYQNIVMAGLSGGGWTTHIASALDVRIGLSIPVAGSIPCDFAHTSWDFEQFCDQPWAKIANYTSLYVLASLEAERTQVQVLHEWDDCCFHGCGRHARIKEYNDFVRSSGNGQFVTSVTAGNIHEVNERDRVIIASTIEAWRREGAGALTEEDLKRIPFSLTPL